MLMLWVAREDVGRERASGCRSKNLDGPGNDKGKSKRHGIIQRGVPQRASLCVQSAVLKLKEARYLCSHRRSDFLVNKELCTHGLQLLQRAPQQDQAVLRLCHAHTNGVEQAPAVAVHALQLQVTENLEPLQCEHVLENVLAESGSGEAACFQTAAAQVYTGMVAVFRQYTNAPPMRRLPTTSAQEPFICSTTLFAPNANIP